MSLVENYILTAFTGLAAVADDLVQLHLPNRAGRIVSAQAYARAAGGGTGNTIYDILLDAVSIFSDEASRPQLEPGSATSDLATASTTLGVIAGGELLTVNCTAVSTSAPETVMLVVTFELNDIPTGDELVTAAEAISAGLVVRANDDLEALVADSSASAEAGRVLGISVNGVASGASLQVRRSGLMTDGAWSWTPGAKLYFDDAGAITETEPVAGYSQIVGYALTATTIRVTILDYTVIP